MAKFPENEFDEELGIIPEEETEPAELKSSEFEFSEVVLPKCKLIIERESGHFHRALIRYQFYRHFKSVKSHPRLFCNLANVCIQGRSLTIRQTRRIALGLQGKSIYVGQNEEKGAIRV